MPGLKRKRVKAGDDLDIIDVDWNDLMSLLEREHVPGMRGFSGFGGSSALPRIKSRRRPIHALALEELLPYSVFGVLDGEANDDHGKTVVQKIGPGGSGSPLMLYTNGPTQIPAGSWANAFPIDQWNPTKVRITGHAPGVGEPCGPEPGQYGIGAEFWGLQAHGAPHPTDGTILVVASQVHAIFGIAFGTITAFNDDDPADIRLGSGMLRPMYRVDSNYRIQRIESPVTQTEPWNLKCFNRCRAEYEDGTYLLGIAVPGIGLIVEPCPGGMPCPEDTPEKPVTHDEEMAGPLYLTDAIVDPDTEEKTYLAQDIFTLHIGPDLKICFQKQRTEYVISLGAAGGCKGIITAECADPRNILPATYEFDGGDAWAEIEALPGTVDQEVNANASGADQLVMRLTMPNAGGFAVINQGAAIAPGTYRVFIRGAQSPVATNVLSVGVDTAPPVVAPFNGSDMGSNLDIWIDTADGPLGDFLAMGDITVPAGGATTIGVQLIGQNFGIQGFLVDKVILTDVTLL